MRPFQRRRTDRKYDGRMSDLMWAWHTLADGTRYCRCLHSRNLRNYQKGNPWIP